MMPVTCGRTSAMTYADVRPGKFRTSLTVCVPSVTTPTSGGGGAGGGASLPHADNKTATRTPDRLEERIDPRKTGNEGGRMNVYSHAVDGVASTSRSVFFCEVGRRPGVGVL